MAGSRAGGAGARRPLPFAIGDRVRLRRKPDRGAYDRASIDAILDACYVGHVGWVLDGQPFVTPTAIWRVGDPSPVQVSADTALETTTFAVDDVAALDDVEALRSEEPHV